MGAMLRALLLCIPLLIVAGCAVPMDLLKTLNVRGVVRTESGEPVRDELLWVAFTIRDYPPRREANYGLQQLVRTGEDGSFRVDFAELPWVQLLWLFPPIGIQPTNVPKGRIYLRLMGRMENPQPVLLRAKDLRDIPPGPNDSSLLTVRGEVIKLTKETSGKEVILDITVPEAPATD